MRRLVQLLLLLLAARPALAGPVYPVSARLTLAPRQEQHCLKAEVEDRSECSVVAQAHDAFAAAVGRMFTSATRPNLQLVLVVTDADVFVTAAGGAEFYICARGCAS